MKHTVIAGFVLLVFLTSCVTIEPDLEDAFTEPLPEVEEVAEQFEEPDKQLSLELIPIDRFGTPGENFDFSMRIRNKGKVTGYPLDVTHTLIDRVSQRVKVRKKESMSMESLISKRITMLLPLELIPGDYTVMTNVSYDNKVAVSSFDVSLLAPLREITTREAPRESEVHIVEMRGWKFIPAIIHVKKGDGVMWVNYDGESHTASGAGFDSGSLRINDRYTYFFNRSGNYPYSDTFHPAMRGKVIVK